MLEELLEAEVKGVKKERRDSARVNLKVPVVVHSSVKGPVATLFFTKDVSKDGLYMVGSKKAFLSGERIYMEFQLPLKIISRRIRVVGRVVRVEAGVIRGYAIKFEKIFDNDYKFLKCYLPSLNVQV